jgi:predicted dinucleotide-binding enzyme
MSSIPISIFHTLVTLTMPASNGDYRKAVKALISAISLGARMMKISILGASNVGGTLGRAWARKGHDVFFGVPSPGDAGTQELLTTIGSKARAGTVAEAATAGDVIVLATPWPATRDAIQAAGIFAGKVVVDCTNPLKEDFSGLALGYTTSGAEQVAEWAKRQGLQSLQSNRIQHHGKSGLRRPAGSHICLRRR